jgi:hypothetical protein
MTDNIALVCTRLVDMVRVHPHQDNSKVCSRCGERVGIYPSSQKALRNNPGITIMCAVCAMADYEKQPFGETTVEPAARWDEIVQESRDSQDVGKA